MIGEKISHYRIIERLGGGGMGIVYKAEDTKLGRTVALKFLPPELTRDPEAKERFIQEARSASALDHDNICTIYDFGDSDDGQLFIAMAFYDGETLKHKLKNGPLPVDLAIDIAVKIASGLQKAHQHGIIHRDIKPANIILTSDGRVKILDFGLAKLVGQTKLTRIDSTIGTVAYMSPEQSKGEKVDHRTDVWSLGVVLYEMLTGEVPFKGEYDQAIVYSILNEDPILISADDVRLGQINGILEKALCKNPEFRYQNASDLITDLGNKVSDADHHERIQRGNRKQTKWFVLTVLVLAITAVLASIFLSRNPDKSPTTLLKAIPFTSLAGTERNPAFSPDGNQIAFSWDGDICVKLVNAGNAQKRTQGPAFDFSPVWSPDGVHIAFVRESTPENSGIYLIPSVGGPETKLYSQHSWSWLRPRSLSWSPDGRFLAFTKDDLDQLGYHKRGISLLAVENRKITPIVGSTPEAPQVARDYSHPTFSPDGKVIAFVRKIDNEQEDIYIQPVAGGLPQKITSDNANMSGITWTADSRSIIFSSDREGNMILWKVSATGGVPEQVLIGSQNIQEPVLSHDESKLAYQEGSSSIFNIWKVDLATNADGQSYRPEPFIVSSRGEIGQRYSPDGHEIAFSSWRSGSLEIWKCDGNGHNEVQLTDFKGAFAGAPSWSPDGQSIAFDARPDGHSDIFIISASGGEPERIIGDPSSDRIPTWSKDGQWLYFISDRTGRGEVWKTPVPAQPDNQGVIQITKNSARRAFESEDGNWLYFAKRGGGIWRIAPDGGEEFQVLDVSLGWGDWALRSDGIYYSDNNSFHYYEFDTGKIDTLFQMEQARMTMDVSPDGRWLTFGYRNPGELDIWLVENYR
jgi:serine/threonine protein kinase